MERIENFKEYKITGVASPVKPTFWGSFGCGCVTLMITLIILGFIGIFISQDVYENYSSLILIVVFILVVYSHKSNVKSANESRNKLLQSNKIFENNFDLTSKPKICLEGSFKSNPNAYQINYIYIDDQNKKLYIMSCLWLLLSYEVKEFALDFNDIIDYHVNYTTETKHTAVGSSFDNPLSNSSQIVVGNAYGTSTQIPTDIVINITNVNNASINLSCLNSEKSLIEKFIAWLKIVKS